MTAEQREKLDLQDILVVDDTPANLQLLVHILSENGYRVRPASSGSLALRSVAAKLPALILLDVKMPEMDGFEICEHLKSDERTRDIPVLFISVAGDLSQKVRGFEVGGVDFITKPFEPQEVLARVKTHLRLRDLTDHLETTVLNRTAELSEANLRLQREINDRIRIEEQLRESEAKFRGIVEAIEQAGEMVVVTDIQGAIQYVNPMFETTTGYRREEVLGKNASIVKSDKQNNEFYRQMWDTIGSGRIWQGRIVNRKKDGSLFVEAATISPVFDAAHKIVGYVAVENDISEQMRLADEKAGLEEQLRQSQKLESIGLLAGGVAHDFNNMLGVIFGYAEQALERVAPLDPVYDDLQEILGAANRSAEITRQLLAFARKQTVTPKVVDLNTLVQNMLKMLGKLAGEEILIDWRAGNDLWPVKVDPSQVDQLLANLCVNARDAIAGVGQITIETANASFDAASCLDNPELLMGDYVCLSFVDSGCGMPKQVLDKIFEPFFTTKGVGKGTGMGLPTVYGIVKQNDGFICVSSKVGEGTSFRIYLRRYLGDSLATKGKSSSEIPKGFKETVLAVEDDPELLRVSERFLEALDYKVLAACTPKEAIRLFAEHSGEIQLVITDVIMPEMDGKQLSEILKRQCPNLRTLFVSGYTDDVLADRGVLEDGVHFLQKPFSKKQLAVAIRQALKPESDS